MHYHFTYHILMSFCLLSTYHLLKHILKLVGVKIRHFCLDDCSLTFTIFCRLFQYKYEVYYCYYEINQLMITPPFGRPEDKIIQRQFMKKIRGDKLQAINAQCQLEICLAFKYDQKPKKLKGKKKNNKQSEDNSQGMQGKVLNLHLNTLQVDRREKLLQNFKLFKEEWKFEEIEENQPLPDYFFDDGCDLSYIIYELQKTGNEEFKQFSAEDLIFLELLCLEGRKLLNEAIITYYETNMGFMISAMKNGLEKIKQKLKTVQEQNSSKSKQRKISNEQGGDSQIWASMQIDKEQNYSKQIEQISEKKEKKKDIKMKKTKAKKSKSKQDSSDQNEEEQNQSVENNSPDGKQLALKTCNYISWAYWYVIKKD